MMNILLSGMIFKSSLPTIMNLFLIFYALYFELLTSLRKNIEGVMIFIFSPSLIDSGSGFPSVSGRTKDNIDAKDTPNPNITGEISPPRRSIYGANIVPILLTTIENPIPIPLTTVGKSSAVNKCKIVKEQLAQNLPKMEKKIFKYERGVRNGCTIKQIPDNIRNIQIDLFRPNTGLSRVRMT